MSLDRQCCQSLVRAHREAPRPMGVQQVRWRQARLVEG